MNNLVWFRNDLRTQDNQSLFQACEKPGKTIGVYCIDPRQFELTKYGFKKTEKFRAKFLLETIRELKNNLENLNITLFVFFEKPEIAIPKLVEDHQITSVFLQKEWTSEEMEVNQKVINTLPNCQFIETYDQFLFHPDAIPYQNFNLIPAVLPNLEKNARRKARFKNVF